MNKKHSRIYVGTYTVANVLFLTGVTAPSVEAADTTESVSSSSQPVGLEEIVVTAQKRAESVDRVGLTITAIGSHDLETQGITSIGDLTRVIPGLNVTATASNTPVYTLRGVGFYDNSLGAAPAVSVYVDEVPLAVSVLTSQVMLDLERVEVLKGPQGTLFGQSSTGGAINFVSAKPTAQFSYGTDLSYGRFQTFDGTAFMSGPLTDTLGYRLAVKSTYGGDWQRSYTRDDTLGKSRVFAGRLTLEWKPSDVADVLFMFSGDVDQSDPQATQYAFYAPQTAGSFPILENYPKAPPNDRAADWSPNFRPFGDDKQYNATIRADLDASRTVKLTSLTSYTNFTRDQQGDSDGIAPDDFSWDTVGYVRSFTQELRASSNNLDRVRWTAGINYENTRIGENSLLNTSQNSFILATGLWETNGYYTNQKLQSYAGFANIEFDVVDQVTLKAGARYSYSKRTADECTQDTDARHTLATFFTGLSDTLRAGEGLPPIDPVAPFGCVNLDSIPNSAGVISYLPGLYAGSLKEHNAPWRVGIDYKPTRSALFYVDVAKGYKSGGFTTASASTDLQFLPVTQESLLDYEAGAKLSFFDRRLQLNSALFYYDYSDKQLRTKILDPVFGLIDSTKNIPKSSVRGAEMSVQAAPVAGLTAGVAFTLLASRIDEFTGYNGTDQLTNFAGTPIPFAPKYSATANADYVWPLSGALSATIGGNFTYNSSTNSTVGTDDFSYIKPYRTLDLRMGLKAPDSSSWALWAWGKNVTNEYYWTNAIAVSDTRVRYAARPATFGVSFSYRK